MLVNRRRLLLLVVFAGAGALSAVAVSQLFLTKYIATLRLDPFVRGGLQDNFRLYQRTLGRVLSLDGFSQFSARLSPTPGLDALKRELSGGESPRLRVEYNSGVSKIDLRDLPDALTREYAAKLVKENFGYGMIVTAINSDRVVAREMAELLGAYMSDTALRLQLADRTKIWTGDATFEIIEQQRDILTSQAKLESLDRRLSEMKLLHDRGHADAGASNTDQSVQVQVLGSRYLSVSQQITAIEAEKVDLGEEIRQQQLSLERTQIKKRIGDFLPSLSQSSDDATKSLRSILAAWGANSAQIKSAYPGSATNLQFTLSEFEQFLTTLKVRYLDTERETPVVISVGPTWPTSTLVGLVVGTALFLVLRVLLAGRLSDRLWGAEGSSTDDHITRSGD